MPNHLTGWQRVARAEYVKKLGLNPHPTEEFEKLVEKLSTNKNQSTPVTIYFNDIVVEVPVFAFYAADRVLAEAQGNFLLLQTIRDNFDKHSKRYMETLSHEMIEKEAYLQWKGSDEVLTADEAWLCAEYVLRERAKQELLARFSFFEYAGEMT